MTIAAEDRGSAADLVAAGGVALVPWSPRVMWFAILTPGAHECRPHHRPGILTVYAWTDVARKRLDGPAAAVQEGLRLLRRKATSAAEETFAPRCFVCRAEYPLPDPAEALAQAWDADRPPDDEPPADEPGRGSASDGSPSQPEERPIFLCVHVPDEEPEDGGEEEALVVLPARRFALAVPLDALGLVVHLLAATNDETDALCCMECGTPAPGGDRSPQARPASRAERRAAARAERRCGRSGRRTA